MGDHIYYRSEDTEPSISLSDLKNADRETKLDVMRTWFFQNYEDPVERTPYNSAEGGYLYIWGGPYEARSELESEFSGVVPDDLIEELSEELDSMCGDWGPKEKPGDYDEYLINEIAQITEYYNNFSSAILDIEKLLKTNVDKSVQSCFFRLLYVNVITAMETYLSDAFINTVVPDERLMRRFVESVPEFKSAKISLSEVFKEVDKIEQRAKRYLADVVWHNLSRVKPLYKDVLEIEFKKELSDEIFRAILNRHDIVHRNGKTNKGAEIFIFIKDIEGLITRVEKFVQNVDCQLREKKDNELSDEEEVLF